VFGFLPAIAVALPFAASVSAQDQREERFATGDTVVRRWTEDGAPRAAWSRDGGATWQPLLEPDDRLHFVNGVFDPLRQPITFDGVLGEPAQNRLFVVQFETQVLAAYRDALQQAGAEILHFMPANALFVRCDARTADRLRELACVRWVGGLQNGFKLDTAMRAFAQGESREPAECNLVLAAKADRLRLAGSIEQTGGEVVDLCEGSVMLRARLTAAQLRAVLAQDTVTWIDEAGPDGDDMDKARILGGGNYVEAMGGSRGKGVRVEITEGLDENHPDLAGRVIVRGSNSTERHGHCTAGIVGGTGASHPSARGMMPECDLIEGNYSSSSHYSQIQGSVSPSSSWRTMVATASWGASQTTSYTSISAAMDDALFDSDLTRLNSQSNTGTQSSRPEAWARNIISVGGIRHYNDTNTANDAWNGGASIGPASDGRLKPDICAFYDSVFTSDLQGADGYASGDYYTGFNGTSAATPIVAGHVGLIHQMFTDGLFGNPLPLAATVANRFANKPHMTTSKALLCNTATQYSFSGTTHDLTRTHQGWGWPSLSRLYDHRNRIVVLDEYDTLQLGQARDYWVFVPPGTPEFRATMVYADPNAQPNASIHLVNDANLKVTRDATGTVWWGNRGLDAGTASVAGGSPNNRDTIECVYLPNPQPGAYIVRVEAASVVQDGKVETPQLDMDFALVMHPVAGHRDTTGIKLDLTSTGPGSLTMQISNLPPTGWTEGFTALSITTNRGLGFGNFFGLEIDSLTAALWGSPVLVGNPFHFPLGGGLAYPLIPYTFDPEIVNLLAALDITLDAVVVLWNAGQIAFVSNVDRIDVQ
jgi:hypothetical protein